MRAVANVLPIQGEENKKHLHELVCWCLAAFCLDALVVMNARHAIKKKNEKHIKKTPTHRVCWFCDASVR
jgi:hypothetical protein